MIKDSDGDALPKLATELDSCEITLTQIGCEADLNALKHIESIVKLLPKYLQHKWVGVAAKVIESEGREPRFTHLVKFIDKKATEATSRFARLASAKPERDRDARNKFKSKQTENSSIKATTLATKSSDNIEHDPPSKEKARPFTSSGTYKDKCLFCEGEHSLEKCRGFREKNLEERKGFVRKENLCNLYVRKGHFARRCRKDDTCKIAGCGKRHHELLHPISNEDDNNSKSNGEIARNYVTPKNSVSTIGDSSSGQCGATGTYKSRISLRIVPVRVKGKDQEKEIETYALLDDGSDVSLCTRSLVQQLGLPGTPKQFSLTTVNGKSHENSGVEVHLVVKALGTDEHIEMPRVWSVDYLPVSKSSIPSTEDLRRWRHL